MTRYENLPTPSESSPFLKAFLQTDRVWDDVAKKEWADDVERRLREVRSQFDPRPLVLGYAMYCHFGAHNWLLNHALLQAEPRHLDFNISFPPPFDVRTSVEAGSRVNKLRNCLHDLVPARPLSPRERGNLLFVQFVA